MAQWLLVAFGQDPGLSPITSTHSGTLPSITPVSGDPTLSLDILGHQVLNMMPRHKCRQALRYINLKEIEKYFLNTIKLNNV